MTKSILSLKGVSSINSKQLRNILGGVTSEECESRGMQLVCGSCAPRNAQNFEMDCPDYNIG